MSGIVCVVNIEDRACVIKNLHDDEVSHQELIVTFICGFIYNFVLPVRLTQIKVSLFHIFQPSSERSMFHSLVMSRVDISFTLRPVPAI